PSQAKCSALAAIGPRAAELFFKQGLDAYRKGQMAVALQKLREALELHAAHELAAQYVELIGSKLQLDADRTLLAWRKDFDAGALKQAAADYRQLVSVSSVDTVNQVQKEYRKFLAGLVESWNQACANNDAATMEKVRLQV